MTTKPVADSWYAVETCENDILLISEPHIDPYAVGDIWLVKGSERALAIGAGTGIVPPAAFIQEKAGKPVIAVAMNSYYDHSGGWPDFSDRACHPLEAPDLLAPDAEQASVADYLNNETLWALPCEGYRVEDFELTPAKPTQLVEDGYIFDLGDRTLEVMHIPGRSPGGLGIWEAATGSLFTSDMLYDGDHGLAWPPEYPEEYCTSLRRLRALPVECVYPGHYGRMDNKRMLEVIDQQLADLERA